MATHTAEAGSENGTAKKSRTDRLEVGYAQALADLRRLTRAAYEGDMKARINDLIDGLEDGREANMRIEDIVRTVKAAKASESV